MQPTRNRRGRYIATGASSASQQGFLDLLRQPRTKEWSLEVRYTTSDSHAQCMVKCLVTYHDKAAQQSSGGSPVMKSGADRPRGARQGVHHYGLHSQAIVLCNEGCKDWERSQERQREAINTRSDNATVNSSRLQQPMVPGTQYPGTEHYVLLSTK